MLATSSSPSQELPKRIKIQSLVSSRYPNGSRPLDWDERHEGIDTVVGDDGATYKLQSDGGQSPPKPGWIVLLSSGDSQNGYIWTLYGIVAENSH